MLFVDGSFAGVLEDEYLEIILNFVPDNPVILFGTWWFDQRIINLRDPKVYVRLVHYYVSSNGWRSAMYRVVEYVWQYVPFDTMRSSKYVFGLEDSGIQRCSGGIIDEQI